MRYFGKMWVMKILLISVIYTQMVNLIVSGESTPKADVKADNTSQIPAVTTDTNTSPATVPSTAQTSSAKATVQTETTAAPASATAAPTTTTTTTTAPATTTVSPRIDANCSHLLVNGSVAADSWCNATIDGEAKCDNVSQQCVCSTGYFKLNSTVCSPESDLEPLNLKVTTRTSSSFTIEWNISASMISLDLSYTVQTVLADTNSTEQMINCTLHQPGTNTANCSGLVPGHKYNTMVTVGYMTYARKDSIIEAIYPGEPGLINISASDLKAPNITVVWNAAPGRVDNYSIVSNYTNGADTVNTSSVHLYGVSVGTTYSIKILSVSYGLETTIVTTFRTDSEEPDPPTNLNITKINDTSIRLTWTAPGKINGDFKFYQVCRTSRVYPDQMYAEDKCENTTGPEYQDTGLAAGTYFLYDVRTVNDMYMSVNATTDPYKTEESVPGAVEDMRVVPNDTYFKVTWQRPASPHGNIIAYQIKWVLQSNPSNNCSAMLNTNQSTNQSNATLETSGAMCKDVEDKNISMNQVSMEYLIHDLEPHSSYNVSVAGYTSKGRGTEITTTGETSISVPDPVTNVTGVSITSTSVLVLWDVPIKNPGPVNYTVLVTDGIRSIPGPTSCKVEGYGSVNCTVTGLEQYWQYQFAVKATTSAGFSLSDNSSTVTTREDNPGKVTAHNVSLYDQKANCDATRVKLDWTEPALLDRNSLIVKYTIISGSTPNHMIVQNISVGNPQAYAMESRDFSADITHNVIAEHGHVWQMFAVSQTGLEGDPVAVEFKTGSCAPPAWDSNADKIRISTQTTSTVSLSVTTQFFSRTTQGEVKERGLLISSVKETLRDMVGADIENTGFWSSSRINGFKSPYKIHPFKSMASVSVTLVIGEDAGCGADGITGECNGPLPAGFHVYVRGYSCTDGPKCTISSVYGPFQTRQMEPSDKKASNSWVIGVCLLIVVLVAVAAFFGLWRKGIIDPVTWVDKCDRHEPEPQPLPQPEIIKKRPFKVSNYDAVLAALHKDTNLLLSDQYGDITQLGSRIYEESTMEAANLEQNKAKNRWVNILPFDHSRVKLRQIDEDDPTSDYINANYMPGFNNRREYIATQGPLPGTIDDFWRMTWEHNVAVVVMLTQCKEGNRVKCEMYWPDVVNEPKQYGDVVVNPQSISHLDKYNISTFQLSVNQQSRQVIHLHYLDFPDFSANVEFDNFIDFVKVVRSHVPHNMEGPMIVHCSAGVGRTGTFMAIDRLLQTLNSSSFSFDQTIDIFDMVISMRSNRVLMVQTESQFVMIHDCLQQLLEAKKAAIAAANSTEHLYENQAFDASPEILYQNVDPREMKTEL